MAEYGPEEKKGRTSLIEKGKKCSQDGCGYTLGLKGGPSSSQLSIEDVHFNLINCLELSMGEIDVVILMNIQGFSPRSYRKFLQLWCKLHQDVVDAKPQTDCFAETKTIRYTRILANPITEFYSI